MVEREKEESWRVESPQSHTEEEVAKKILKTERS